MIVRRSGWRIPGLMQASELVGALIVGFPIVLVLLITGAGIPLMQAPLTLLLGSLTASAALGALLSARSRLGVAKETLSQARATDFAHSYQNAVQQLACPEPIVRVGAIAGLKRIGSEGPPDYQVQVEDTLGSFLQEIFAPPRNSTRMKRGQERMTASRSRDDVRLALQAIALLRSRRNVDAYRRLEGTVEFSVKAISLQDCSFYGGSFAGMEIVASTFSGVTFEGCSLDHSSFDGLFSGENRFIGASAVGIKVVDRADVPDPRAAIVRFRKCDLRGAEIILDGNKLVLDQCQVDGTTALAATDFEFVRVWTRAGVPELSHARGYRGCEFVGVYAVDSTGIVRRGEEGEYYQPGPDQVPVRAPTNGRAASAQ